MPDLFAVLDAKGRPAAERGDRLIDEEDRARILANECDKYFPTDGPHRVVTVTFRTCPKEN